MGSSRRARTVVVVLMVGALALTSCTDRVAGRGRPAGTGVATAPGSPTTSTSAAPPGSSAPGPPAPVPTPSGRSAAACPTTYAQPDPRRPRVVLKFDLAAGHERVTGTEQVDFTPDADITELVFRLTANTVPTFANGTRIDVTSATADHGGGTATYSRAGAAQGSQGGLLHIPFAQKVVAGTTVRASLAFTLVLDGGAFDRFGRVGKFAWFASAHPLLAWERGFGWHVEPMLAFAAESATSEAAQTDLTVTAPAADTILMSGRPLTGTAAGAGRRSWHAVVAAARDVSVAAGPFAVQDLDIGSLPVRIGAPTRADIADVAADEKFALAGLTQRFGPFPFPTLSVVLLPVPGGGIEYPSSILLLGSDRRVAVHETAHQWFYAMVGNSQAQHAWLDEAFASYAEQLLDRDPPLPTELDLPGPVDRPTSDYGADVADYYRITYNKGSVALHAARQAAGAGPFDAAVRCYVNAQAWSIAEPADVVAALAGLPAALKILRAAGAVR